ncbi:MAG: hypothetical protein Q8898_07380 [Bacillota bacterium]|nr:hypothetical protein [Bacillota bacterium]
MKKSEWSDKRITDLLREMPKIQDHRHPNDIYQNVSTKMVTRKPRAWIMPVFTAAAAIILLFLLSPGLLTGQFSSSKQNASKSADPQVKFKTESNENKKKLQPNVNILSTPKLAASDSLLKPTALYDNEVGNGKVLTYWIPDKQAQNLIPVSTTVVPDPNKSWMDLFNDHMSDLKEEQWGLSEYYPLQATLKLDQKENAVIADVRVNNPYTEGTNSTIFQSILQNVVQSNSDSKKIKLTTNGNPGIYFGDFGELRELPINKLRNRAYFLYHADGEELPYLVPAKESFQNIKEAMVAMEQDRPNDQLKASLGTDFQAFLAGIDNNNNTLIVKMKPNAKMEDNASTLYSFEALLLTAKDFGLEKVKLENASISKLGSFDLTVANKVPVGANYRSLK